MHNTAASQQDPSSNSRSNTQATPISTGYPASVPPTDYTQASPRSSLLPYEGSTGEDINALMRRHAELEARRQRILELQRVEEEQAEIAERIRLAQGQ